VKIKDKFVKYMNILNTKAYCVSMVRQNGNFQLIKQRGSFAIGALPHDLIHLMNCFNIIMPSVFLSSRLCIKHLCVDAVSAMGDWALLVSFKLGEHGIWSKEAAHTLQSFIPVKTSVLIAESILMAI
jgi:hypothetical protein